MSFPLPSKISNYPAPSIPLTSPVQGNDPPSTEPSPPLHPTMTSRPDDQGGMDIASDDDTSEDRTALRGIKRAWQAVADEASEQTDLPSTPPEIKRPRTAVPEQPQIPTTETLSYSQHAKLIHLIQAHGGTLFQSEGDMATFALPPAANIKFQIDYFCLKDQMLRNDQDFPGRQAFLDSSQATFRYWLNEVSSINQPDHVERLLATGLGKHEGPMLRELAERARAAGSLKAAEALSDWPEYWVDGVDLEAHSWPTEFILSTGSSGEPLLNGKSYLDDYLRQSFFRRAFGAFKPSDVAGGLHRLFPPEHQPACGTFRLRSLGVLPRPLEDLLRACGAVVERRPYDRLSTVVCSADFDSAKLQALLLQRQASETAETAIFDAALLLAAYWGDEALYHTLQAREPADRYAKLRPLLAAAAAGSGVVGIVTQLLAEEAAYAYDFTRLFDQAALYGRTAVCKLLLDTVFTPEYHPGAHSIRSHWEHFMNTAVESGNVATCAMLLVAGAPPDPDSDDDEDSADIQGETPLLKAARLGYEKICRLLITAGASLDRVDSQTRMTASSYVASHGQIELYKFLLDHGAPIRVPKSSRPPLWAAAQSNQIEMMKFLVESGANIEQPYLEDEDEDEDEDDNQGDTPLLAACASNSLEAVTYLLSLGAEVDPNNAPDHNALVLAVKSSSLPLVQRLLQENFSNACLKGAIDSAIAYDKPAILEALLQRYPKYGLTFTQSNQTSPLFQIQYSPSPLTDMQWGPRYDVLSLLLKALPAPERHINGLQEDALMLATQCRDEHAVWLLLEAGFRVGQRDTHGRQALDYALSTIDSTSNQQDKAHLAYSASASRILRLLGRSLRQQPNAQTLTFGSWQRLRDAPIATDLAVFMMYATSDSTANIAAMIDYEQGWMSTLRQLILDGLTNTPGVDRLITNMHMPSALSTWVRPLLHALPALRDQLFTPGIDPTPVVLAAVDGLYLSLELQWATIAQACQTYYAGAAIDEDWQTTLTTMAHQWLDARISRAYESESTDIAPVFAELFERCLSLTPRPVGTDLQTALSEFVPMHGQVAALLGSAGIYAPLAREIGIAWARTCQQVRASILTSSSLRSDEELIDSLLAAFRTTLGAQLYQPGANTRLIDFAGAGPAAASLHASLISRQLHMLGQFISPEAYSPG